MRGVEEPLTIDGVQYVSAATAAQMLGIKPASLYAYASRGRIRSYRQGNRRQRLYRLAEVEELLGVRPASTPPPAVLPDAEDWIPFTG